MSGFGRRREEDIRKIRALCATYNKKVELVSVNGTISDIKIRLHVPTASTSSYPTDVQSSSDIQITLPARYPFEGPKVIVLTPIWNPNIFPNGTICLGTKWLPAEGLDMLVERVIKILSFDPIIINTSSPANAEANKWYISAKGTHPAAFPSIGLSELRRPRMVWTNVKSYISVTCKTCSANLKISSNASDKSIKCPNCKEIFRL